MTLLRQESDHTWKGDTERRNESVKEAGAKEKGTGCEGRTTIKNNVKSNGLATSHGEKKEHGLQTRGRARAQGVTERYVRSG